MRVQRVLAPILSATLVIGVALAVYVSFGHQRARDAFGAVATASGSVGSEKKENLSDPRVLAILAKNGSALQIETSGSRDMTTRSDLKKYDFAFPAGVPAAKKIDLAHARDDDVFAVLHTDGGGVVETDRRYPHREQSRKKNRRRLLHRRYEALRVPYERSRTLEPVAASRGLRRREIRADFIDGRHVVQLSRDVSGARELSAQR